MIIETEMDIFSITMTCPTSQFVTVIFNDNVSGTQIRSHLPERCDLGNDNAFLDRLQSFW